MIQTDKICSALKTQQDEIFHTCTTTLSYNHYYYIFLDTSKQDNFAESYLYNFAYHHFILITYYQSIYKQSQY